MAWALVNALALVPWMIVSPIVARWKERDLADLVSRLLVLPQESAASDPASNDSAPAATDAKLKLGGGAPVPS